MIIPNLDYGGAQESFVWLSNRLAEEHKVINVVFNTHNMGPYVFKAPLLSLDVPASAGLFMKLIRFFRRIQKLRQIKQRYKVDISISFLEGADYVNVLSRLTDRVILSFRGSKKYDFHIRGFSGWLRHRVLIPYCTARASAIVTLNKGVRNELIQLYKVKTSVSIIHNALSPDRLVGQSLPAQIRSFFDVPVIISHGRLSPEKGYDKFLAVMAELKSRGATCRFLLIGDGPEYQRLCSTCRSLNLRLAEGKLTGIFHAEADVYLAGYCANPVQYLKHAAVFVLPSLHEGFSHSLGEALLCGIPVVAADCPYGPREILAPGTERKKLTEVEWAGYGVLVPQWHVPQAVTWWADALQAMLADRSKREQYGRLARQRANDFSENFVLQQWKELLENVHG
ncbi:MAG: glycosyl transferase [Cyclobacteriaceae bacterium]|nr:MAG: glycosyl transferase [Cyclobacteriaceae bacterium]